MPDAELPFGKYRLLDRIAAGGMAEIFRARYSPAPGVTKQVVIKKILPHYAENKNFIAMFTNEARIAMGLSHGNIAQVFDFGSIDGDYFLAMELVDGQPLSKILKRMKTLGFEVMPPHFAAYIAGEMLKGLHYAHNRLDEQGRPLHIVHRDVSPQNVLVSYESQVKLVDFGIARARHSAEDTSTGSVKGKYVYFSPEQARGKELDARADVFSAGVVLYEMLVGQLPFQGKMMDAVSRIVKGQFARPREIIKEIPEELERIVLKAMALEPSARYPSAEAFQHDLARSLSHSHAAFTPAELTMFLNYLFEQELVEGGRPVKLPPTFTERIQSWKRRPKDDDEESPTEMTTVDPRDTPALPPQTTPLLPVSEPHQPAPTIARPVFSGESLMRRAPSRRTLFIAAAAGLLVLVLLATLLTTRSGKATLEINSTPGGASVRLDGRALEGTTPLLVSSLEGDRTYQVEVNLAGRQVWRNAIPLKRGQHLIVNAPLELPPAPPPPKPTVTRPAHPPVKPVDVVTWPVRTVVLDLARHHLDLNAAGATVVKIDPSSTYRVGLSANQSVGWAFYVVNDAGATPVVFSGQPLQIKSAAKLMAFHYPLQDVGAHAPDDTRPRTLSVTSKGKNKSLTHTLSPDLDVASSSRVLIKGLDRESVYEFTPRHSSERVAKLRASGLPLSVLLIGTESGLSVIPFDVPTRITGTEKVIFTVVDDEAPEPQGLVEIEAREMPIIGKKR